MYFSFFRDSRTISPKAPLSVTTADTLICLASSQGSLNGIELDGQGYTDLLTKLIGEWRHVQNNPRQGLIPKESQRLCRYNAARRTGQGDPTSPTSPSPVRCPAVPVPRTPHSRYI